VLDNRKKANYRKALKQKNMKKYRNRGWIHLAQYRDQRQALINTVMKP